MSNQYILPLFKNNLYHPDNFIISNSNEHAYRKIRFWSNDWGVEPYKFTLLLNGPASSGKTYITKIWQNFSNALLLNNHLSELNQLLVQKSSAFIIENIESLDEYEILHAFNLINEYKKHLLITTRKFNNSFSLEDLSSRINSVMKITLLQPDDEFMTKLIFKYFSDQSIIINEQIINFLLINLPREFNALFALLKDITDFALKNQQSISINLIKTVLMSNI